MTDETAPVIGDNKPPPEPALPNRVLKQECLDPHAMRPS